MRTGHAFRPPSPKERRRAPAVVCVPQWPWPRHRTLESRLLPCALVARWNASRDNRMRRAAPVLSIACAASHGIAPH
jgi:hypothetical protein